MLNQIVRPFTAKWHRLSLQGAFDDAARCAEFRAELEVLQTKLLEYTRMLGDLAGVEDLTKLEAACTASISSLRAASFRSTTPGRRRSSSSSAWSCGKLSPNGSPLQLQASHTDRSQMRWCEQGHPGRSSTTAGNRERDQGCLHYPVEVKSMPW